MKSNIFMFAALTAVIGFTSCTKDEDIKNESKEGLVEMTLGVGTASTTPEQTRAFINTTGMTTSSATVKWATDDVIKLYSTADPNGQNFSFLKFRDETNYPNAAYFHGWCNSASTYYVIYPASAASGSGTDSYGFYIEATIPTLQDATVSSFDPKAMIQTGATSSTTTDMVMNHTCGFLHIKLPANVASVKVEPMDKVQLTEGGAYVDYYICGKVKVTTASGKSAIEGRQAFLDGKTSVTLQNVGGKAGDYLICVAPTDGYPGLRTTVTYTNGKTKVRESALQTGSTTKHNLVPVSASYVVDLGEAPAMPTE